jgi:exodeoxyribonuclease VII large subunit
MGRLPFDPAKMAAAKGTAQPAVTTGPSPEAAGTSTLLSVTQLAAKIERTLRDTMPGGLRVLGEVGQFRERTHWYFDLKDEGALISCVMFASQAVKTAGEHAARFGSAGWQPQIGDRVIATGRVEFFGKQGRTQLYVTRLEPAGEGDLDAALRKLVEELRTLGWLDPARKRRLPSFPRRIAIVTSRTGAALQDVLDTFRRRCPAIDVALLDVRVQGDGSADEVARALRWVSAAASRERIDAVLLTRGGGSKQDLWTFNERVVAQAIIECAVPVVAAIGHETDTTLAELVADERASTPTQAAMRLSPDRTALLEQLDSMQARMHAMVSRHLRLDNERLRSAASRPCMTEPQVLVDNARATMREADRRLRSAASTLLLTANARVDRFVAELEQHRPAALYERRRAHLRESAANLDDAMQSALAAHDALSLLMRLDEACRGRLQREEARLAQSTRGLELVGPQSVFKRGFSATFRADGSLLRSHANAIHGDTILTRLADGSVRSTVMSDSSSPEVLRGLDSPRARTRPARTNRSTPNAPGLFDPS